MANLAARRAGAGTSTRAARAYFGGWIVALTAVYYAAPDTHVFTWTAIGLSGAVAILLGVRLNRPSRRLPWFLLAGALVVFTAGDTVYNTLLVERPTAPAPGVVDVLYLLVYPLLATGFVLFIRTRSGIGNRAALLDALVPTVALGLLAWVYWIEPYTRAGDLTVLEKAVSIGYPVGDVLVMAMTLRLLTMPGRRPFAVSALAAATVGVLVSDVIYGQSQLNSDWSIGGPIDLGWILFYGAMGFSALHPSMRRRRDRVTPRPARHARGTQRVCSGRHRSASAAEGSRHSETVHTPVDRVVGGPASAGVGLHTGVPRRCRADGHRCVALDRRHAGAHGRTVEHADA